MEKCYALFFKTIHYCMLAIACYWLMVSLYHIGKTWSILAVCGLIAVLTLLFVSLYWTNGLNRLLRYLLGHKMWVLTAVLLFQVALLLSANLMIRSDAAVVWKGAFKLISNDAIASYLTRNPNNLFLFLYERFVFHCFGQAGLWVLQGINIACTHVSALILYRAGRDFFSQTVADTVFLLYVLLLGFSPYFMAMYTDMLALPFLSMQIYWVCATVQKDHLSRRQTVLLGMVTAVALFFRPTSLIAIIALCLLLTLQGQVRKCVQFLLIFSLSCGAVYGLKTAYEHCQTEVVLLKGEGLSKGMLTFVNLGLTYTGSDQADMKEGLLSHLPEAEREEYNNGMFKDEYVWDEIKRRIRTYTPISFLDHLSYKLERTVADGTLDWLYTSAKKQKTAYVSPLYAWTKSIPLASLLRKFFLYTDEKEYKITVFCKQVVWLLLAMGLIFSLRRYRRMDFHQLLTLSVFGGLLFLMIFEGGKSRYLIQFLPSILLLASLGLVQIGERKETK